MISADDQRWWLALISDFSWSSALMSDKIADQRWWQLSALTKSATVDKIANGQRWSALTINGQKSLISAESADVKSCTADQQHAQATTCRYLYVYWCYWCDSVVSVYFEKVLSRDVYRRINVRSEAEDRLWYIINYEAKLSDLFQGNLSLLALLYHNRTKKRLLFLNILVRKFK